VQASLGWVRHHIIPISIWHHPLLQAAENVAGTGGFAVNREMNCSVLRGYLLAAAQHAGNHPQYTAWVYRRMTDIMNKHGGATPAAIAEFHVFVGRLQHMLPRLAKLP